MIRSSVHAINALLIASVLLAIPGTSCVAGTKVQVQFAGSGQGQFAGIGFSGCFQYDQSQPNEVGKPHHFVFTGPTFDHEICYDVATTPPASGQNVNCEPFSIDTSGNGNTTFQLQATLPSTTTVMIIFNTAVTFTAGHLPLCQSGSTSVFPQSGTFTLINANVTKFSGQITWTTCAEPTGTVHCVCNPPPAAQPAAAPMMQSYVYVYSAPLASPVNICRPQPACCLSRLFSRCFVRARCW